MSFVIEQGYILQSESILHTHFMSQIIFVHAFNKVDFEHNPKFTFHLIWLEDDFHT